MRKFLKYTDLVWSGRTLKDKKNILYSLFFRPRRLREPVLIRNKFGTFLLPKTYNVWQSSAKSRPELFRHFEIGGGTFLDVGAMIGKYSLMVSRNPFVKVIAVEPEKGNFEVLKKNVEISSRKNVLLINAALSNEDGERDFYISDRHGSSSLLRKTERKIRVKCHKLDTLVKDNGLEEINLIKIDVEGAEIKVLEGAKKTIKRFRPKIVAEIQSEENLEEAKKILQGYKVKRISSSDYVFEHQMNNSATGLHNLYKAFA